MAEAYFDHVPRRLKDGSQRKQSSKNRLYRTAFSESSVEPSDVSQKDHGSDHSWSVKSNSSKPEGKKKNNMSPKKQRNRRPSRKVAERKINPMRRSKRHTAMQKTSKSPDYEDNIIQEDLVSERSNSSTSGREKKKTSPEKMSNNSGLNAKVPNGKISSKYGNKAHSLRENGTTSESSHTTAKSSDTETSRISENHASVCSRSTKSKRKVKTFPEKQQNSRPLGKNLKKKTNTKNGNEPLTLRNQKTSESSHAAEKSSDAEDNNKSAGSESESPYTLKYKKKIKTSPEKRQNSKPLEKELKRKITFKHGNEPRTVRNQNTSESSDAAETSSDAEDNSESERSYTPKSKRKVVRTSPEKQQNSRPLGKELKRKITFKHGNEPRTVRNQNTSESSDAAEKYSDAEDNSESERSYTPKSKRKVKTSPEKQQNCRLLGKDLKRKITSKHRNEPRTVRNRKTSESSYAAEKSSDAEDNSESSGSSYIPKSKRKIKTSPKKQQIRKLLEKAIEAKISPTLENGPHTVRNRKISESSYAAEKSSDAEDNSESMSSYTPKSKKKIRTSPEKQQNKKLLEKASEAKISSKRENRPRTVRNRKTSESSHSAENSSEAEDNSGSESSYTPKSKGKIKTSPEHQQNSRLLRKDVKLKISPKRRNEAHTLRNRKTSESSHTAEKSSDDQDKSESESHESESSNTSKSKRKIKTSPEKQLNSSPLGKDLKRKISPKSGSEPRTLRNQKTFESSHAAGKSSNAEGNSASEGHASDSSKSSKSKRETKIAAKQQANSGPPEKVTKEKISPKHGTESHTMTNQENCESSHAVIKSSVAEDNSVSKSHTSKSLNSPRSEREIKTYPEKPQDSTSKVLKRKIYPKRGNQLRTVTNQKPSELSHTRIKSSDIEDSSEFEDYLSATSGSEWKVFEPSKSKRKRRKMKITKMPRNKPPRRVPRRKVRSKWRSSFQMFPMGKTYECRSTSSKWHLRPTIKAAADHYNRDRREIVLSSEESDNNTENRTAKSNKLGNMRKPSERKVQSKRNNLLHRRYKRIRMISKSTSSSEPDKTMRDSKYSEVHRPITSFVASKDFQNSTAQNKVLCVCIEPLPPGVLESKSCLINSVSNEFSFNKRKQPAVGNLASTPKVQSILLRKRASKIRYASSRESSIDLLSESDGQGNMHYPKTMRTRRRKSKNRSRKMANTRKSDRVRKSTQVEDMSYEVLPSLRLRTTHGAGKESKEVRKSLRSRKECRYNEGSETSSKSGQSAGPQAEVPLNNLQKSFFNCSIKEKRENVENWLQHVHNLTDEFRKEDISETPTKPAEGKGEHFWGSKKPAEKRKTSKLDDQSSNQSDRNSSHKEPRKNINAETSGQENPSEEESEGHFHSMGGSSELSDELEDMSSKSKRSEMQNQHEKESSKRFSMSSKKLSKEEEPLDINNMYCRVGSGIKVKVSDLYNIMNFSPEVALKDIRQNILFSASSPK